MMVKTIYWLQHAKKSRSRKKIMTKMEKCCTNIWAMLHTKKNGKPKTNNWCKTSKQQKGLFKMYIETKLYVKQTIWQ